MKSTTVKFNIFTFLATLALIIGYYQHMTWLPKWASVTMMIVGILISQLITYISPSGEFVGHGQNWTIGKWITRIGLSLIAILGLVDNAFVGLSMIIAGITPFIEIIIRAYGSDTPEQQAAARVS